MAVSKEVVLSAVQGMSEGNNITHRLMFGGAALYCDTKVVGLLCDDELFIKPTEEGRSFVGEAFPEKEPFPKGKPWFFISHALIKDRDWLSELVRITAKALPLPKKKKKRVSKG